MGEFEPRACEGVRELVWMLQEAPRDLLVGGIEAQGEIGSQHGGTDPLRRVMCARDRAGAAIVFRTPLVRAGGALGQLPFVTEQVLEELVTPFRRGAGPGDFQAAGDGITGPTGAVTALPAEALCFQLAAFGLRADVSGGSCAVRLAEGMSAGDQRHGFFVIHGHTPEGFANIACRGDGIRLALRAFRIHVDETHLHRRQRIGEVPLAGVARVRAQPLFLGTPVDVVVGFPYVLATAGKAEGFEAHGFEGDVSGQDHEIGPGDAAAVFLFDRPQQATRLVEAGVVRPTVQRGKALLAAATATSTVTGAVGAGAVPGHPDEQGPVVTEVRRPPWLRVGHQCGQVFLDRRQVQAFELLGIVEVRAHGIGLGRMLM